MSDEPATDQRENKMLAGIWETPLLKAIFAFAVVLLITFLFRELLIGILVYFKDIILFWETNEESYPLLSAISNLELGLVLLLLAGLLIAGNKFPGLLADRRWLRTDDRKKGYLVAGAILGAIVFTAATFTITVAQVYQIYNHFDIPFSRFQFSFVPEELLVSLIMLLPLLAISVGKVALIQGFFQPTLSKKYGAVAGIAAAAFVFMILGLFPEHLLDFLSPSIWQVDGVIFLTGAVAAYLFYRTKSLYAPIGFLFAWNLASYILSSLTVWYGFTGNSPITAIGPLPMPFLESLPVVDAMYITIGHGTKAIFLLVTLFGIWYFRNKTLEDLNRVAGKIKGAYRSFLSNLARN